MMSRPRFALLQCGGTNPTPSGLATHHYNRQGSDVMREALTLDPFDRRDTKSAEVMSAAFEAAWSLMGSSRGRLSPKQACDARVRLARLILERVEQGERDALRLGRWAMALLNANPTTARHYL
jgi:hypothetical protein